MWSKDPSTKVGAVVVDDDGRLLAQGYNGFPRGIDDREDRLIDRSLKYRFVVHAEMNCIYNAGYTGVSLKGSSLFIYGLPVCSECAKGVIQSGIRRVYMCYDDSKLVTQKNWQESFDLSEQMFKEAGVYYDSTPLCFPCE